MYRKCAAVHHVLLMPPIIKNLFAFLTEICYDVYKGYDTPSKRLQKRMRRPPLHRSADSEDALRQTDAGSVRCARDAHHTDISAADLYAAPGSRAAPELLHSAGPNQVPPKWQRRDEINSRLGAPLSFFFVS